jgi:hypothetical protein
MRGALFDHLVGAGEEGFWDAQAQCLGGVEVDSHIKHARADRRASRRAVFGLRKTPPVGNGRRNPARKKPDRRRRRNSARSRSLVAGNERQE